jgi:hypothetical protein
MQGIARKMEDMMVHMFLQMLNETSAVALEVGNLADQIVDDEGEIVNMGGQIGHVAVLIVGVERKMCQFAEKTCGTVNGTCPTLRREPVASQERTSQPAATDGSGRGARQRALLPAHPQASQMSSDMLRAIASRTGSLNLSANRTLAKVLTQVQAMQDTVARAVEEVANPAQFDDARPSNGVFTRAARLDDRGQAAGTVRPTTTTPSVPRESAHSFFPNPVKWMALMEQLMQKTVSMCGRMLKNMADVVKGIASMGSKCAQTSRLVTNTSRRFRPLLARRPGFHFPTHFGLSAASLGKSLSCVAVAEEFWVAFVAFVCAILSGFDYCVLVRALQKPFGWRLTIVFVCVRVCAVSLNRLIAAMAGQIGQMVSRIAATVNTVDQLVKDCKV